MLSTRRTMLSFFPSVFFVASFLAYLPQCNASSVQIKAASAQSFSRSIVRTSGGNIYVAFVDTSATPTIRVYESTNGGSSWIQMDAAHAPSGSNCTGPSAAIDGSGIIHVAYWDASSSHTGLRYITFSTATNTFSGDTSVAAVSAQQPNGFIHTSIAVDSNNVPHVMYEDGVTIQTNSTTLMLTYIDKVGGRWNKGVRLPDPSQLGNSRGEILIDQNNIPQISYAQGASCCVIAGLGNANKAIKQRVLLLKM
jgi:hypothetical protein